MTDEPSPGAPLDVATLKIVGQRSQSHPLVTGWAFEPDAISPRRLSIHLDAGQYPAAVETARLDVRWFENGDYTLHYRESNGQTSECRWDRHPKPDGPRAHFHPPPDAGAAVASPLAETHHLGVVFRVLDWMGERVEMLHGG